MTTERVEYEFVVTTKGNENVDRLRDKVKDLDDVAKESKETTEGQTRASAGLDKEMVRSVGSLRTMRGLWSKLSGPIGIAGAALTAAGLAVNQLNQWYNQQIAQVTTLSGVVNQYTTEFVAHEDILKRIDAEAKILGFTETQLYEAYTKILPVTRDWGLAQGIVQKASLIHSETLRDFLPVVDQLSNAYANGTYVMDEYGGKILFGEKAVDALTEAWIGAGEAQDNFIGPAAPDGFLDIDLDKDSIERRAELNKMIDKIVDEAKRGGAKVGGALWESAILAFSDITGAGGFSDEELLAGQQALWKGLFGVEPPIDIIEDKASEWWNNFASAFSSGEYVEAAMDSVGNYLQPEWKKALQHALETGEVSPGLLASLEALGTESGLRLIAGYLKETDPGFKDAVGTMVTEEDINQYITKAYGTSGEVAWGAFKASMESSWDPEAKWWQETTDKMFTPDAVNSSLGHAFDGIGVTTRELFDNEMRLHFGPYWEEIMTQALPPGSLDKIILGTVSDNTGNKVVQFLAGLIQDALRQHKDPEGEIVPVTSEMEKRAREIMGRREILLREAEVFGGFGMGGVGDTTSLNMGPPSPPMTLLDDWQGGGVFEDQLHVTSNEDPEATLAEDELRGGFFPMAEGGIVTQPTLAMIGEAGPEKVTPLGAGGEKQPIIIELDGKIITRAVTDELNRRVRMRGAR